SMRWIAQGRVTVNDQCAHVGQRIDAKVKVRIDGELVTIDAVAANQQRVLAYRKPEGVLCTRSDGRSRPTVFDHLPTLSRGRWITVGRLDINTSGLLLITTDGELAAMLMHPSAGIEREYACRVQGEVTPAMIGRLTKGVMIDNQSARFERITDVGGRGSNHWYRVVLIEGRNREVRKLWQAVGVRVSRLIRVRFGPIELDRGMRLGKWRELSDKQCDRLRCAADMPQLAK
ncbi:MAG: pseudouridine synthase, partial [Gammaproteobacteria bacterium]|nr:pseudouridine synthase [Gammaproteobacteria bacterium]